MHFLFATASFLETQTLTFEGLLSDRPVFTTENIFCFVLAILLIIGVIVFLLLGQKKHILSNEQLENLEENMTQIEKEIL